MMIVQLIAGSALWISLVCSLGAQERAVTASGRTVILNTDGTWRYADQPANSKRGREKPPSASERVDVARGKASLFYDPSRWRLTKSDEPNRTTLAHVEGDGYALVIAERIQMSSEALRNVALANAKEAAPDARIVSEEKRVVNGREVQMLQIHGTLDGIQFVYLGYYYAGPQGTFQVLTYTAANLVDEYRPDFERLLDGFTVVP